MIKLIGLSVAVVSIAGSAEAGEWEIVARSDNIAVGIDRLSIRASGDLRTFWKVAVFRTPRATGEGAVDYDVDRVRIDCERWTIAVLTTVAYRISMSAPVSSFQLSGTPSPIVPDTVGEAQADYVCRDPQESITAWAATAEAFAIERRTSDGEIDKAWREQREPDLSAIFGS